MNTFNENLLSDWGRLQRQSPKGNEIIKVKILENFSLNAQAKPAVSFKINFNWLPLALAGLAVLSFFIIPSLTNTLPATHTSFSGITAQTPAVYKSATSDMAQKAVPESNLQRNLGAGSPDLFSQPPVMDQTTPISDNRELLKIYYSATIQTGNVQNLADRVTATVRGLGGRVDSINNSSESGYLAFVIPADKFETFRSQIKGLVNYRFYSETTQSENMLPEKLNIEDRQTQTSNSINQLASDKNQLIQNHARTVASLNSQLQTANKKLSDLQNQTTTDANLAMQIEAQKQDLANQIKNLQNRLSSENYNYSNQLDSLNSQIQDQQDILAGLDKQTSSLLNNVATVNGTISLEQINSWQIFNAYVPAGYWVTGILLILALVTYFIIKSKSQFLLP